MPGYVLIVDFFGMVLAGAGFTMAFRQAFFRRLLGRAGSPARQTRSDHGEDPITYILRIAGVIVMAFGIAIASMVTLFHLA
jgi:hypothetical protein